MLINFNPNAPVETTGSIAVNKPSAKPSNTHETAGVIASSNGTLTGSTPPSCGSVCNVCA